MLNAIKENNKGNTVIEAVVALAIFTFLVLSVTGIFKMTIEAQRSALAAKNIQESMRYALEVISKELRGAQRTSDCFSLNNEIYHKQGQRLQFKNIYGQCVQYRANTGRFEVYRDGLGFMLITPDDIRVSNIDFEIQDYVPGSNQARVTIKFTSEMASGLQMHKSTTYFQTTISSRYYE